MQHISLNSLYYFWQIAKAGSLKQAALQLHLTQPTLSHQLKSLETSLNTDLFERQGRSLKINKHGKIVQEYCDKIFSQIQEMQNVLALNITGSIDKLGIGVIPSMSKSSVYDFLAPYIYDQSIRVAVKEDNLKYLLQELEMGELDIIFTDFKIINLPKSILQRKFYKRDFVAVCNPNCKLIKKPFPQNLTGLKFVNYTTETTLNQKITNYLNKNSIKLQDFTEVDDTSLIKEICLNETFAAILPASAVKRELREKKLKKLGNVEGLDSDIFMLIYDDNKNDVLKQFLKDYLD